MLFIARAMQRAKGKSSQHPGRALLAQEAPLLKSRLVPSNVQCVPEKTHRAKGREVALAFFCELQ